MNNIDYSNYTLEELLDVKHNIDSGKYPERYQKLLEEIFRKESEISIDGNHSQLEHFKGDPVAKLTDWAPLEDGGSNFKTHKLVEIDHWRIEFKPTIFYYLFVAIFTGVSLYVFTKFGYPLFESKKFAVSFGEGFSFIAYLFFIIFSVFLIYKITEKIVFDKDNRVFWKGRKEPKRLSRTSPPKNHSKFKNIHAIQLLTELCDGGRNSDYYSFELNLILKDGKRINVIDHGDQDAIREDANQLALFLNIPVWEFQDEKERSFFERWLGLRF